MCEWDGMCACVVGERAKFAGLQLSAFQYLWPTVWECSAVINLLSLQSLSLFFFVEINGLQRLETWEVQANGMCKLI